MFENGYRPRRPTKAEEHADEEQQQATRRKRVKRAQNEHDLATRRDSGLVMSAIPGIGYRDFALGPSKPSKTRTQLDQLVYSSRRLPSSSTSTVVPSLQSICISRVADGFGSPAAWDHLDRYAHLPHVPALLQAVLERIGGPLLPFDVWRRFAMVFSDDLPTRRRTYRGLCVADEAEIDWLKEENELAMQEWASAGPRGRELAAPSYFLAILDLAHDVSFADQDLSKLRRIAPLLAVLKLDYTRVSDDGVAWIARLASQDGCYQHLQVLSLKGLRKVTDEGVLRLAKLRLRMLDLRETACTKRLRSQLNQVTSSSSSTTSSWSIARYRQELDRIGLELELFGGSFSLSRTLTYLHSLAHRLNYSTDPSPPPTKPISVHLSAITRQQAGAASAHSSASKTAEELYTEQMALSTKPKAAAYHQAYGAVTSTMNISRQLLEDSGIVETEKGAAFRSRNDAVLGGSYIGPGKTGGRSMFEVGHRKLSAEAGPLSDSDEELEMEEQRRAREVEAAEAYDAQPAGSGALLFYRAPRPVVSESKPRSIVAASPSDLILLRHLPYRPPYDPSPSSDDYTLPLASPSQTQAAPFELGAVKLRKRQDDGADDLLSLFSASSSSSSRKPTPSSRPVQPPKPTNPFAAKRKPTSNPPPRRAPPSSSSSAIEPALPRKGPVLARPLGLAPMFRRR
ncbi:hypothetical protein BCR35DRAFT_297953 [Leucosporidium creatinivorum]|uniref:Uncharacterized protein n=1 Tax=Leucosporidium creatinivorum TaxID=106004 RepID=A0A1Y2G3I1_9BASI|nr:hypothetical protein BCR35DRAFT_297953 [Leucosporidium creatinivorum]